LLLAGGVLVPAQQYVFREHGAQEGLSSQSITAILEDRAGFLWVGTRNGLFRFDGHNFRAFTEADGLPHPNVMGLHESPDGTLWVGAWGGLAWSEGGRFRSSSDPLLRYPISVGGIGSDKSGQIYVATRKGLAIGRLNGNRNEFEYRLVANPPGTRDSIVTSVFVEPSGAVWFGCSLDICRLDSSGVRRYSAAEGAQSSVRDRWQFLLVDRAGTLWARRISEVAELAKGARTFIRHGKEAALAIFDNYPSLALDIEGRILAPTHRGVAIREQGAWRTVGRKSGMPVNSVTAAMCDREGTLWLGCEGVGLLKWVGYGEWEGYTEAEGLAGDRITRLIQKAPGEIWVGTDAGLNRGKLEGGRWTLNHIRIPGLDYVRDMEVAADGSFWISSPSPHLLRYDPVSGKAMKVLSPAPDVVGIAFDSSGRLWVATNAGIFRGVVAGGAPKFQRSEPPSAGTRVSANDITEDRDGHLWVGTFQGLLHFDGKTWRTFRQEAGLRSTLIAGVIRSPDGGVWIHYFDPKGIAHARFEQGRLRLEHFDQSNGLPGPQATAVFVDASNRLWVATDHGVGVRQGGRWVQINRASGLIWDETSAVAVSPAGDDVWIGTARGISRYVPRFGLFPESPPAVAMTEVLAGGRPIEVSRVLNAAWSRADSLLFRFRALNRRRPVQFQYRLGGFDQNWRVASEPEAAYSFLPRGRYRFEVRARAPGSDWSSQPARFDVDVRPPIPLSVWLSVLAAILLGLGGRHYWRRRLRRVEVERQLLECRVAERTIELSTANQQLRREIVEREKSAREKLALEEQLRHSQKMEALGRLAGGVAHDFNNLLTVINGYSQLALRKIDTTHPVHNQIRQVLDAGERATSLTRQLLALSRKQPVERSPVGLNQVVKEMLKLLRGLVDEGVKLEFVPSAREVTVMADPGQLQQVLMNLAVNARDAMPGGGMLRIQTGEEIDAENQRVMGRLLVEDTGTGMSEEVRQQIFEPFYTTKEPGRGTGLGLALVYGIVQQHEGAIRVTSEPGKGSRFEILLPAAQASADSLARPAVAVPRGGTETILLTEDQREVRALASLALRSLGYEVLEASTAEEAERICAGRGGRVDLLLSDIMMPGASGPELAARITAKYPPVKVLLTSGYLDDRRARAADPGTPFLQKPYSPESLAAKVREILDAAPAQAVSAATRGLEPEEASSAEHAAAAAHPRAPL
jgi:signal transduction histidine kinase/DNA-binding NarL/FixJ family response regulator